MRGREGGGGCQVERGYHIRQDGVQQTVLGSREEKDGLRMLPLAVRTLAVIRE